MAGDPADPGDLSEEVILCRATLTGDVHGINIWGFPQIRVPQNGWFIEEILLKIDDLGVPPFQENPIWRCPFRHWGTPKKRSLDDAGC